VIKVKEGIGEMRGTNTELFADWGVITTTLFEKGILKDLEMAISALEFARLMANENQATKTKKTPGVAIETAPSRGAQKNTLM